MQSFKKKFKEWVYSFSTGDHYAEYDPNNIPNFNMGKRSKSHAAQGNGNPSSLHLTGDEEMNIGLNPSDTINFDDIDDNNNSYMYGGQEGVSEILLAWRHIDSWTEEHNPDLNATLGDPVTNNDINQAEEDLEISFPPSVKVSLRIHDGQEDMESMTGTSGLIYGLQLMTLDQVVAMTQTWRSVASNMKRHQNNIVHTNAQPTSSRTSMEKGSNSMGNSTTTNSSSNDYIPKSNATNVQRNRFKLPFIPQQNSIPPDSVQPVYAHAEWIPLVTDHAGNHIGVDLAPGPKGTYGQVIIFGRDFDTKYVVAANWGEFLLSFANDLEEGNWWLVEENDDYLAGYGELAFRDKKNGGPIQDYLEVLKKRTILKYKESLNPDTTANISTTTTTQPVQQNNNPQPLQTVAPEPIEIKPTNSSIVQKNIHLSKESLRVDDENDVEAIITEDEKEEEESQEQDQEAITVDDKEEKPQEQEQEANTVDDEDAKEQKEDSEDSTEDNKGIEEIAEVEKDQVEGSVNGKEEINNTEVEEKPTESEVHDETIEEPVKADTKETSTESKEDNTVENNETNEEESGNENEVHEKLDSENNEKSEEDQEKKIEDVTGKFENVAL